MIELKEKRGEPMKFDYTNIIINELKSCGLSDPGEINYCKNYITNAFRKIDDNCDNFRLSFNGQQDEEYKHSLEDGCCGFYDDVIKLNSGNIVKFGFNYGH